MGTKKIVLVGIYLEGIYPRGENDVEANLLAPALLKTSADSDPTISEKYEIKVLNLPASLSGEKVADLILKENPVAVGYSAYIWNIELMCESAQIIRSNSSEIMLFLGGPEVTYSSVDVLTAHPQFNFVICGSGEARFKDILRNKLRFDTEPQINGITYRDKDNQIVRIEGVPVPEDMTKIPSPFQAGIFNLDDGNRHCVFMETYRGCIFKCGYCMWMGDMQNKNLNLYPIEQVLKDIEIVYNNPNVASVVFTDACIFYTRERAKLITQKIASCKYKIPTILTLDIAFMNEEAVEALQYLDLSHQKFHFGMQSVNMETMQLMSRKIGPKLFKKRVEMLRSVDPELELSLDLIYGLPGDTYNTFRKTVEFALSLSPIKLNLSPLILLPGSTFWNEKDKHEFVYEKEPPFLVHSNRTYSSDDMRKTRKFVLGIIMIMYFPMIRDTIYKMTIDDVEDVINEAVADNDFGGTFSKKEDIYHSRLGLIELFIEKFEKNSKLMLDVDSRTDTEHYSVQQYDYIRKSVMDEIANPVNAMFAYEAMLDIIIEAGVTEGVDDIHLGFEYYQKINSKESMVYFVEEHGKENIERVKFGWVVSSEVEHEYEAHEVPKTESGGVGAMC